MRRDALFLVGLAAVLVTGGAFAFFGGSEQPAEALAGPTATAAEEGPGTALTAATAHEHDEREDRASGPDSGTGTASRESVTSEQAEALRPGPLLQVVHGKPPLPVADCPIHFVERAMAQQRHRQSGRPPLHDMDLPFLYGGTLRTGADGKVRLPSIGEPIVVSVLHEGEFGTLGLDRRHKDEVTLHLRQDETLRLEVRDHDQHAAAGVPLALYQGESFGKARQIWAAATDASGNAVASHFQEFRGPDNQGARFCAAVRLPLAAPVATVFQGKPLQTEPVRLQLPATGRMELNLTDRQGTPLLSEGTLALVVVRPEGFTLDLPLDPGFDVLRVHKPLGEEPVVFEQIGTGIELRPQVKLDQEPRGFRAPNLQSPQRDGEVVRARIALPDDFTVLAGSIEDLEGKAAAMQLSFDLARSAQSVRTGQVNTLSDGRFDLALRFDRPLAPASLELRRPESDPWQGVRVNLQGISPGERRDLGVLRLQSLPQLVAGLCVDDLGQPLAGANVRVQLGGGPTRDGRGESWNDSPLGHATTGEDGRFAIFGVPPPFPMRVQANAAEHFGDTSPPFGPGAELRLCLQRSGRLNGTAMLPEWLPADSVTLRLAQAGPPGPQRQTRETSLQNRRQGRFQIDNLRPGAWEAVVVVRNLPDPVQSFDSVMIAPGDNQDVRMQPIDLRSALFRYRLQAIGPSGPLAVEGPVLARLTKPDGSTADVGFRMQKGQAELITQSTMMTLTVFARGYPPQQLTLVPGDHQVYMQPLWPAYVRLPGLRALCGPERRVRVSAIFAGQTMLPDNLSGTDQRSGEQFSFPRWEMSRSGGGWLDNTDTAEVILSRNGVHDIVLRIYEDQREQGSQVAVPLGKLDVVLDGAGANTYTMTFDEAKVVAAVQEAEQRRLQRLQQESLQPQQPQPKRGR